MVLSKNMQKLVAGSSTIRKLFEEGIELAKEVGAENVYDFSLGNPAAPAMSLFTFFFIFLCLPFFFSNFRITL